MRESLYCALPSATGARLRLPQGNVYRFIACIAHVYGEQRFLNLIRKLHPSRHISKQASPYAETYF